MFKSLRLASQTATEIFEQELDPVNEDGERVEDANPEPRRSDPNSPVRD